MQVKQIKSKFTLTQSKVVKSVKDSHCNTPTTVLYNWTFYPFIDLLDTDKFVQHLWRGKRIAAKSLDFSSTWSGNRVKYILQRTKIGQGKGNSTSENWKKSKTQKREMKLAILKKKKLTWPQAFVLLVGFQFHPV